MKKKKTNEIKSSNYSISSDVIQKFSDNLTSRNNSISKTFMYKCVHNKIVIRPDISKYTYT